MANNTQPLIGVCYYPEHWPEGQWAQDAHEIRMLGLERVRIGEFSWSRIEPERNAFDWSWLDRAIDSLADAGLQIIMCTPTACPPKWLIDEHPDILPLDEQGQPRQFGSRRHYCFSSETYLRESARITRAIIERYAENPAIVGWQLDNEYGCHATTAGLSEDALDAFRNWLEERYTSIEKLNDAWGTVFWSQEYRSFDEIDLPFATVTEANPAHRLDHWRFSSDQVANFNQQQADILREHKADSAVLTHNFMGNFVDFDHYKVAADLDIVSWDSYPLGFLETDWFTDEEKQVYRQTGHPDWAAFHHDLYRGVGNGRFGVMEQQPGPVNWAKNNAAPLAGAVRMWSWEAFAHGAEFVNYFRWRQVPFAQEQMHAGLQLPDYSNAPALDEVKQLANELKNVAIEQSDASDVALLFDYEACAILNIQPHGELFDPLRNVFDYYRGLRRLGLNIDILPVGADLQGYPLVVIPCLPVIPDSLVDQLKKFDGQILIGARSGSKTQDYQVPDNLPPGPLRQLLDLQVVAADAMRPGCSEPVFIGEQSVGSVGCWREQIRTELEPIAVSDDDCGIWFGENDIHYLAGWPDAELLNNVLRALCKGADLPVYDLPDGIRYRRRGKLCLTTNHGPNTIELDVPVDQMLLDGPLLPPGAVAAWFIE